MRLCVVLFALLALHSADSDRQKRFLIFPTNSFLTLSGCLAKGGIILQPPAFVFTMDFDILFQLPNTTRVWDDFGPYKIRRQKRDLYLGMEELLDKQGLNGRACILRALCEARQTLGPGGGLMQDFFHAIFTLEPRDEEEWDEADNDLREHDAARSLGVSRYPCHNLYSSCPHSLLYYALY